MTLLSRIKNTMLKMLKKIKQLSFRRINFIGLIICLALLGFAWYLQTTLNLPPCPLCVFQRIVIVVLAILFLIGALSILERRARIIHSSLLGLCAVIGAIIAGRHVWIQQQPLDQIPSCGPGLDYLLKNLSLEDAFSFIM